MSDPLTERIRELADPLAASLGLYVYDIELVRGRRQIVRVSAERRHKAHAKDGITVHECAELSGQLSRVLELEEVLKGAYTLEVGSPGLERKLRTREHFAGAVGEHVVLVAEPAVQGQSHLEGVLVAVEGDQVVLEIGDKRVGVALPDVRRAHTVYVG